MIRNRKPDDVVFIYKLVDPRTRNVGYVGQTKNIEKRYNAHCGIARGIATSENSGRIKWLQSLGAQGLIPEMIVIQTTTPDFADEIEDYWIRKLSKQGQPLTNSVSPLGRGTFRGGVVPMITKGYTQLGLF
jgi:hypothetical protein